MSLLEISEACSLLREDGYFLVNTYMKTNTERVTSQDSSKKPQKKQKQRRLQLKADHCARCEQLLRI